MVFPGSHKEQTIAQGRHGVVFKEYANEGARTTDTSLTDPEDIGKIARQTSDGTYYILDGVGPLVWKQIASGGGGGGVPNITYVASTNTQLTDKTGTFFAPISGFLNFLSGTGAENAVRIHLGGAGSVQKMRGRILSNSRADAVTVTLRKNTVTTAFTTTIAAGSTTAILETPTPVSFTDGDTFSWELNFAGTGSGTIVIANLSIERV